MNSETIVKKGAGLLWKPIVERLEHRASDGIVYEFIDYWDKIKIVRLWAKSNEPNSLKEERISIFNFSVDDLKAFGVWDILSDNDKKEVESRKLVTAPIRLDENGKEINPNVKIRRKREVNEAYVGIAREYVCKDCGKTQKIAPAIVIKRCKDKNILPEEYEKIFVCTECNPVHKGRQANPKYANYPKEIKCSFIGCTFHKKQQPSMSESLAKSKGITAQEYFYTYLCKEHRPAGKHRGKKASGKYDGMAKVIKCVHPDCKFSKDQHPSITLKLAEAKGLTFDQYINSYLCKEHRVKKVHFMTQRKIDKESKEGYVKVVKEIKAPKGSKKRGRQADPKWAGMAKELICKGCGVKKVQHPSITLKAAIAKKVDYEFYVDTWKCKACKKLDK